MLAFENPTFEELNNREYLVTNGIGGYSSATLSGANSRRYHGLLVASMNPPTQRQVLVSKTEELVATLEGKTFELSSNQYPGVVHPQGYQYIRGFERSPMPRTFYEMEGAKLSKTVFMVHGSNTVVLEYENTGEHAFRLAVQPFFVDRDYHSLFHEDSLFDYYFEQQEDALKIHSRYGSEPLFMRFYGADFSVGRSWFHEHEYNKEAYRGLDFKEDTYTFGNIDYTLEPGQKAWLTFTLEEEILERDPWRLKEDEMARLDELIKGPYEGRFLKDLLLAGDQFIVRRQSTDSYSILAGYHWFTDWGRDTMIAMRGLCIATGRQEVSRSILQTFFAYLSKGMLPNRFPDFANEKVEYNTVDATLWLFVALYEYYQKFGDKEFIQEHFDKLTDIIDWHKKGTRYNIHLTEQGFIYAGEGISQLTWMDARVGDYVVTPRHGCPVEIQALWYNALKIYQFLASEIELGSRVDPEVEDMAQKVRTSFAPHFFNEQGYLNDVVVPGTPPDESIRPNQLYVLCLPFSLLEREQEEKVFGFMTEMLYTPFGMRTLNTEDPQFRAVYGGDQWSRDTAYHQGTVWPFLIGDYFSAMRKIEGDTPETRARIDRAMRELERHFYERDCIHGISEIFDGEIPNDGRGTAHQAWSIGTLLLACIENELDSQAHEYAH